MSQPSPSVRGFFAALAVATADPDDHDAYEAARETARAALASAEDQTATMKRAYRAVFQEAPPCR